MAKHSSVGDGEEGVCIMSQTRTVNKQYSSKLVVTNEGGKGGFGVKGVTQVLGVIKSGFINCRGWWSREVDVKLMLSNRRLDVLGLAETFSSSGGGGL